MGIHNRVSNAVSNAAQQHSNEVDGGAHSSANAAIATMFNWLSDPSDTMLEVGKDALHDEDERRCRSVWSAMLTQAQMEAGFAVTVYGSPDLEDPEVSDPEDPTEASDAAGQSDSDHLAPAADPPWTRFLGKLNL